MVVELPKGNGGERQSCMGPQSDDGIFVMEMTGWREVIFADPEDARKMKTQNLSAFSSSVRFHLTRKMKTHVR